MSIPKERETHHVLWLLVLLNALVAAGEWWPAPHLNDGALHLHQVDRLEQALAAGRSPLDHWDPTLTLGHPFARTYSMGSHLLVLAGSWLTGLAPARVLGILVWLLWSLWPLTVAHGARWLGLAKDQALGAALAASFLHAAFRFGIAPETYFWLGHGMVPNLFGLVLFPIAVGLGYRFITRGQGLFPALVAIQATWFCHLIMGYLASITLVLLALPLLTDTSVRRPACLRLASLGSLCLLVCAFFLVPYVLDGPFINHSGLEPDHYWDSHGAAKVTATLLTGGLLDHGMQLPYLSLLALIGLVLCIRGQGPRLLLVPVLFWAVAFMGRSDWNPACWLLPANGNLPLERLLVPLQWALSLCSGIGLAWLVARLRLAMPRRPALLAVTLCLLPLTQHLYFALARGLVITPAKKRIAREDTARIQPELARMTALMQAAEDGGRLLVPHQRDLVLGTTAYHQIPLDADLPHIGSLWHSMSLNAEYLGLLNPSRPDHLDLFGVKYALGPTGHYQGTALLPLTSSPGLELYTNPRYTGLFTMGRLETLLPGYPGHHVTTIGQWLRSAAPAEGRFLAFDQGRTDTELPTTATDPRQGFYTRGARVDDSSATVFAVETQTREPGWLIGKFSYHPNWRVTVDDRPVTPTLVSPSYPAIYLLPGTHRIAFTYTPHPWTQPLFLLALTVFAATALPALRRAVPLARPAAQPHFSRLGP